MLRLAIPVAVSAVLVSCGPSSVTIRQGVAEERPAQVSASRISPVPVEPKFRAECSHFESLDFGRFSAKRLQGHVSAATRGGFVPMPGVQVAARQSMSGSITFAVSDQQGGFDLGALSPGDYQVWTCLDGYDELRFLVTIDVDSSILGFDMLVGPSEARSPRGVVPLTEAPGPPGGTSPSAPPNPMGF
jgi:hypothetical protein